MNEPQKFLASGKVNPVWLQWKRHQTGLGQRAVAKRIGMWLSYLGRIELGQKPCPADVLQVYEQL